MNSPPLPSPYRSAAILAAFSRASDEPARDTSCCSPVLDRPSGLDRLVHAFVNVVTSLVVREGERGTAPGAGPSPTGETHARLAAVMPAIAGPGDRAPALASHFDLCHTADLRRALSPDVGTQAA